MPSKKFVALMLFLLPWSVSVTSGSSMESSEAGIVAARTADNAVASAVISDLADLQEQMLCGPDLESKRVVLCKTVAGLGNRIQGIMSCLALAVATRRALVVQWEREVSTTPPLANGLMPCRLEEVLEFPSGLDLNVTRAFKEAEEARNKVVEVFASQMVLQSGKSPSWGDLLLCKNLTYMLKDTPVLSIPAWRWMPELLSNPAYRATMERLFGSSNSKSGIPDPPMFYRSVAPWFVRPASSVLAAASALMQYWAPGSTAIGLQVRLGLETDNQVEADHFFSPPSMWRSWLRCAYAALSQERVGADKRKPGGGEVWFVAADSTDAKVDMMMQMSREEGPVVAAVNLELVTNEAQRAFLFRENRPRDEGLNTRGSGGRLERTGDGWLDGKASPVVIDFASGARLVFFGAKASRVECGEVQAAMVEMEVLSWSRLLVTSHLSTFAALAAAHVAPGGIFHVNRDGDCFPALSLEPLSDAGELFRDTATCFSQRHQVQHSWTRPRRRATRRTQES